MPESATDREWFTAIAGLVASDDATEVIQALVDTIDCTVSHGGTCLLAFHASAPPEVLHHTLDPAGERHYVDRYLAGPYLLDPLYQLAVQGDVPEVCRYRDQAPDRFRSSEYYRQYCERTHLKDEVDFLRRVDSSTTLALVVGRRERRFAKADIVKLQSIAPLVNAALEKIWRLSPSRQLETAGERGMHRHLTDCFDRFGEGLLTERERQITQHLLRGYSTKAIARQLGIAPGTVMVHKRNLFTKLGISSQYELFSQFIDALSAD